jgi:hypothetical protein
MKETWYASKASCGQGLVIDEATGANIAVAYDDQHTNLLAAAPALLKAAQRMLARWDALDVNNLGPGCRDIAEQARAAISFALGD